MCVSVSKKSFECDGVPFTSFLDWQLAGILVFVIAVSNLQLA